MVREKVVSRTVLTASIFSDKVFIRTCKYFCEGRMTQSCMVISYIYLHLTLYILPLFTRMMMIMMMMMMMMMMMTIYISNTTPIAPTTPTIRPI